MTTRLLLLSMLFPVSGVLFGQTETEKPTDTLQTPGAKMPIFSTTSGDADADMGSQDVSGLLQSSRDVFTSTAGYNFGNARFRLRGLGSENSIVMINGVRVNDLENGWASWSGWGGLNDVTRYMEVRTGISASDQTFGGMQGYSNMDVRASKARKGTRISYAYSNRSYRHRMMVTHSTGLLNNGFAITVSASRRYAKEGYVEGTFFDAWSYFLSVEKKLSDKHSIGFVGFGAPMRQGRQALSVQETYDLTDNNYYNPNWGYQNGEKRNARVSEVNKPMFILTDYLSVGKKGKLETSLFYSFGKTNLTGLNWFDAKNPSPNYYRYLPSYYALTNPAEANRLTAEWGSNTDVSQINWSDLYNANAKNLYTVVDAGGVVGNNITGNRSKYIIENNFQQINLSGLNMNYNNKFSEKLSVSAGINYTMHRDHYYKTVNDLLGGDFWVDVDNLAELDATDPSQLQNNLEEPNKVVGLDEIYGYNYNLNINRSESFGQIQYKGSKSEAYGGVMISTTKFWREGFFQNGRFPETSKGEGEKHNFFNYGIKGGYLYKLSGRHYLSVNAAHLTRAPLAREAYLAPRIHDAVVNNLKNESLMSFDLNYIVRYGKFKSRATFFYNTIKNITMLNNYFHEDYNTIINYVMTGVNQQMMGLELGAEYNVTPTITANGVLALGDYRYTSRPHATITRNNSSEILVQDRLVYFKNYRLSGMPQDAASIGLKYNSPKYWFVGMNFNYFADLWLEPNPDRRTAEAVDNLVESDPQWAEVLDQTKLDNQFTMDAYGGKSWRIKKYTLNWSLNINNILNNRNFVTGGFEQLRYENNNVNKFPPRLSYHLGLTLYTMISLRF